MKRFNKFVARLCERGADFCQTQVDRLDIYKAVREVKKMEAIERKAQQKLVEAIEIQKKANKYLQKCCNAFVGAPVMVAHAKAELMKAQEVYVLHELERRERRKQERAQEDSETVLDNCIIQSSPV